MTDDIKLPLQDELSPKTITHAVSIGSSSHSLSTPKGTTFDMPLKPKKEKKIPPPLDIEKLKVSLASFYTNPDRDHKPLMNIPWGFHPHPLGSQGPAPPWTQPFRHHVPPPAPCVWDPRYWKCPSCSRTVCYFSGFGEIHSCCGVCRQHFRIVR